MSEGETKREEGAGRGISKASGFPAEPLSDFAKLPTLCHEFHYFKRGKKTLLLS